jgi:hypothetical protein
MLHGVQIDLISEDRLDNMTSMEKVRLILENVKEGTIVVLEKGLDPEEQSTLIEYTMMEISPDGFSGIEMETYPAKEGHESLFTKLFGKKKGKDRRLTVIGPANQMRMLKTEADFISAFVTSR